MAEAGNFIIKMACWLLGIRSIEVACSVHWNEVGERRQLSTQNDLHRINYFHLLCELRLGTLVILSEFSLRHFIIIVRSSGASQLLQKTISTWVILLKDMTRTAEAIFFVRWFSYLIMVRWWDSLFDYKIVSMKVSTNWDSSSSVTMTSRKSKMTRSKILRYTLHQIRSL